MRDFLTLRWSPQFAKVFPVLLLALVAIASLPGCATVSAPTKAAETVEQKAFAVYGTFVIFEEAGADIVENTSLPLDVRRAVQNTDRTAKPVADALVAAALEAQRIRLQVEAGANTVERLDIATANLERWIARAGPLIDNLVAAVRNGSK